MPIGIKSTDPFKDLKIIGTGLAKGLAVNPSMSGAMAGVASEMAEQKAKDLKFQMPGGNLQKRIEGAPPPDSDGKKQAPVLPERFGVETPRTNVN